MTTFDAKYAALSRQITFTNLCSLAEVSGRHYNRIYAEFRPILTREIDIAWQIKETVKNEIR